MRIPEFLKPGGNVGFVAPSFGCNIEPYKSAFDSALAKIGEMGYVTYLGPNCYKGEGIGISSSPEACANELMDMYEDDAADVIISVGGGELMCEILSYMDFDRIAKAKPKWYMGYSDNTNFTFLSAILADTAAIYGPCAGEFGMIPWDGSVLDAWETLLGNRPVVYGYDKWEKEGIKDEEHPTAPFNLTEDTHYVYYPSADRVRGIEMEGRLIGGCMDCLVNISGTSLDKVGEFLERYKDDGFIWFLEACDLTPFAIRRTIWNLKNSGWFKYVKGFMIGRPLHFGEVNINCDQYNAVTDLLSEFKVPIVMDLDIGHLSPMMPLITGAKARVKAMKNDISIEYIPE